MNTLRLYFKSIGMLLKSHLQYPSSFFMQALAQLVMEGGELLMVILIVDRFDSLKNWSGGNLYFFFGVMSISFYLTEIFGRGITGDFPMLIRTGRLDTFLVRPRSVFTQVICSGTDPRRIACVAVGTTALIMGSILSNVVWTPLKVLALIESIAMSCLLILGLFMTEAIFSIFSVKSVEVVNVLTYGGRSACQYPIDIYPLPLKALFTIIAPFALTMHVPASYIMGKPLYGWPTWTAFVTPLSGVVVFAIMITIFNIAMRHYRSTGN